MLFTFPTLIRLLLLSTPRRVYAAEAVGSISAPASTDGGVADVEDQEPTRVAEARGVEAVFGGGV